MRIHARAKINWTLNITGVLPNGYHQLDMLMQPLSLHDTLVIEKAPSLSLTLEGADQLTPGDDNLILRAGREMQKEAGVSFGASIHLIKRIPMGAGLGGGSADAAAALKGLNALWNINFHLQRLCQIGVKIGADVPFCLHDAPRRAKGIGEILTPIQSRAFPLVLIQPCQALSTREVFTAYRAGNHAPADTEQAEAALADGDLSRLRLFARNVLESASIPLRPEIEQAKEALYSHGAAFAQMTGSGSVVFGAFESGAQADKAFSALSPAYPVCLRTDTAL